jgi:hemoglobin/transferrin/lactoferrin receptor protein
MVNDQINKLLAIRGTVRMTNSTSTAARARRLATALAAATALGAAAATAQAPAADAPLLGRIVLLGTGLPTAVFDNPSSVAVVDEAQLERIPPARTVDLLRRVPGVRVDEQGLGRLRLRGESSLRVQVLVDGMALTDHTPYGTPIVIDPASIERIEVVRGASSVVSGTRAIGGVVNIVTKREAREASEGTLSASYFSATRGWRLSGSVAGRFDGWDWRVTAGRSELGDQRAAGFGRLVPSDVSDRSLQFHLGRRFDNHYFSLQHTSYDTAANQFILDPAIRFAYPERDLRRLALFYEGENLTEWMPRLSATLYRQTIDRLFINASPVEFGPPMFPTGSMGLSEVDSRDAQLTWGLNAQADLALLDRHRTTVGFQYDDDFLDASSHALQTLPDGRTIPSDRQDEARIRTTSLFVSHEAPLAPGLTANFGLRAYWVRAALEASSHNPLATNSDRRLVGSAGLVWQPTDAWALRGLISQGYNYPNLKQLFTVSRIEGASNVGNPDLRPERSLNFELGARHDDGRTILDLTLFHMRGRDYIIRDPLVDCPPGARPQCRLWVNISRARSTGLEIHAEHALDGGWTPFVSAAVMRRSFTFPNGFETADTGVPRVAGTIGVRRDLDWGMRPVSLEAFI